MVICTLSNAEFVMRWKGKIIWCFLNWIFFVSMHIVKRLKIILGLMWKKVIGIIQRFQGMPRNFLFYFSQLWIYCCPSYKWCCWRKGSKSCAICYYVALVAIKTSHVGIWGIEIVKGWNCGLWLLRSSRG